jgi:hypothetical protein
MHINKTCYHILLFTDCGIDSRWCHWNFSYNASGPTMALESTQLLTGISTRNIFWDNGGRCVGLKILPPSYADCLKIWDPQPPGTFGACQGL